MTFLIPRILTFSAGAQHLFVVASSCQWMDTVVCRAGGGGATGSCSHHQPAQDQPTPARGRSSSPHRRAAPRHSAAAAPCHAAATRPELTCVGCSGSESAAARPSPGPAALSTAVCSPRIPTGDTERGCSHGDSVSNKWPVSECGVTLLPPT